jgi:hypothetical protein
MLISGSSSCGKTTFLKDVLKRQIIDPWPKRIIWLFKRWQPLYDEIQELIPSMEFIKGIPTALDQDSFLDITIPNMIILDDLMGIAGKDNRVTDLFCEGSHHRNLSVVLITQTLFYTKDPTQRRNCQYMTLFKSPSDMQQISILAKAMYPQNTKTFMREFRDATDRPFGHLFIDLKPETPENERLKSNIFDVQVPGTNSTASITECHNSEDTHQGNTEVEPTDTMSVPCLVCGVLFKDGDALEKHIKTWCPGRLEERHSGIEAMDKNRFGDFKNHITCGNCGMVIGSSALLSAHMKYWCPSNDFDSTRPDTHEGDMGGGTVSDNDGFRRLLQKKIDNLDRDSFDKRIEKYIEDGMEKGDAKDKIRKKKIKVIRSEFFETYSKILRYFHDMDKSIVHKKIMKLIRKLRKKGIKDPEMMAIKKYEYMFEPLIRDAMTEEDQETDTESEHSDDGDNDEEEETDDGDNDEEEGEADDGDNDEEETDDKNIADRPKLVGHRSQTGNRGLGFGFGPGMIR